MPSDRPLTLSSYVGFPVVEAYVKHLAVGAAIPDTPLFIDTDCYVEVPLDATYGRAFQDMPAFWREVVEGCVKSRGMPAFWRAVLENVRPDQS